MARIIYAAVIGIMIGLSGCIRHKQVKHEALSSGYTMQELVLKIQDLPDAPFGSVYMCVQEQVDNAEGTQVVYKLAPQIDGATWYCAGMERAGWLKEADWSFVGERYMLFKKPHRYCLCVVKEEKKSSIVTITIGKKAL